MMKEKAIHIEERHQSYGLRQNVAFPLLERNFFMLKRREAIPWFSAENTDSLQKNIAAIIIRFRILLFMLLLNCFVLHLIFLI